MDLRICFACEEAIGDAAECPSCHLPQTPRVKELFNEVVREVEKRNRLRSIFGGLLIAVFVAGILVARALFVSAPVHPSVELEQAIQDGVLSPNIVVAHYITTVQEEWQLGIRGWHRRSDGSVVVELTPPSENPQTPWEQLSPAARRAAMEEFSKGYLNSLMDFQLIGPLNRPDIPLLFLAYLGDERPLAVLMGDGKVRIFSRP